MPAPSPLRRHLISVESLGNVPQTQPIGSESLNRSEPLRVSRSLSGRPGRVQWVTSALLGLRRSELLAIRWDRIDLDRETVLLDGVIDKYGFKEKVKTASSKRLIPLPKEAADALKKRRANQREEQMRAGSAWNNNLGLAFTNELGEPLKPAWATRRFKVLCHEAELPVPGKPGRYGLHGPRYTRASIAPALAEATAVTSAILGHRSASITLDTYTSLPVEMLRGSQLPGWDPGGDDVRGGTV
jgi:integrase